MAKSLPQPHTCWCPASLPWPCELWAIPVTGGPCLSLPWPCVAPTPTREHSHSTSAITYFSEFCFLNKYYCCSLLTPVENLCWASFLAGPCAHSPSANVWCCHDAQIPGNLATNIITRGVILPRAATAQGASHGAECRDVIRARAAQARKTINKERVKTTKQPFTSYGKQDKMTGETRQKEKRWLWNNFTSLGILRESCEVWGSAPGWCLSDNRSQCVGTGDGQHSAPHTFSPGSWQPWTTVYITWSGLARVRLGCEGRQGQGDNS